jgi:tripartite-type tricarboxylate transporter receptor subunit TctC
MRDLLTAAAATLLILAPTGTALARDPGAGFPSRTIRIIVPFAPGGATDILARLIGRRVAERWGQPVVIDNRGGAGGTVGMGVAAKAEPDGHTIVVGTSGALTIAPHLHAKLPYDPLKSFAPLTLIATVPQVLMVHPSLPVHSVRDLIAYAKQRPAQLNFSSSGVGVPGHVGIELFQLMAGIRMVHVPFTGGAPAIAALMGGQVQVMSDNLHAALPHIKAGKVRALAVSTATRADAAPELPTIAEAALPGFEFMSWFALLAPAGMPKELVALWNAELVKILTSAEMREQLDHQGAVVAAGTPQALIERIRADTVKWGKVVKAAGVKIE